MSDDQFTLLDLRKAPPSPDQLISAGSGLPSFDVAKATSPSVKPLSAPADLPWERAILRKSSRLFKYIEEFRKEVNEKLDEKASQASLDRLTNTIDSFVKRLDDFELEQASRDRQFERLLEWARKVSKKNGSTAGKPLITVSKDIRRIRFTPERCQSVQFTLRLL